MKKLMCIVLALVLCCSIVACGEEERPGEAKTPETSSKMQGKDFMDVVIAFTDNGFLNVTAEPMEDLSEDEFDQYGKVDRVTVNGTEDYPEGEWMSYLTEVVIYYHSTPIPETSTSSATETTDTAIDDAGDATQDTAEDPTESTEEESGGGFFDWLNKDVPEFEFELNEDGKSYTLLEYNYISPASTEKAEIPATYEGLPVTKIADQAFYACSTLEEVIIPEGVTSIGEYAFYHCDKLSQIQFPSTLRSIKSYAFEGCKKIETVDTPWAINIGFRAFYECTSIKSINIGNAVDGTSFIDEYAFYKCSNLENADLEGVTTIDGHAFTYCENLKTIKVSKGLIKIGDSAFEFCRALETIYYNGAPEDFLDVDLWPWWNKDTGDYEEVFSN